MSNAKAGIVVFPGSNCDYDVFYVLKKFLNIDTKFLWHNDKSIGDRNIIVLPGGFSYGDYLRCGAIARFSGIMNEVVKFAERGGIVIGICNGFQILCECGLLPGTLMRNNELKFICKSVSLKVENNKSIFTSEYDIKENINLPVAHGEGKYYCDDDTLSELLGKNQILFTYNDNPNGSVFDIAGIQNEKRNVIGMMPHPERAADEMLGNTDGLKFFQSAASSIV